MRNKELFIIISLLLTLGAGLFLYRVFVLDFSLTPNKSVQSWHVEAKVTFRGQGKPVRAQILLPRTTSSRHTIVDENFVSDGFGLTTREEASNNRIATWTKRSTSKSEILYYRGILYETRSTTPTTIVAPQINVPLYDSAEFAALSKERADYFALGNIIQEIRQKSADDESFVLSLFKFLNSTPSDSRLVQLMDQNEKLRSPPALAVHILEHAGIPARIMNGVSLEQTSRNIGFTSWAQVYMKGGWLYYNTTTHTLQETEKHLQWWVGDTPFYTLDGAQSPSINISVKKHTENALTEAIWNGDSMRGALYKISIFNLPVDIQLVFSVLLLVPIGALIVCFTRQIIGVQTFGTFMPVLVALAFRETQLAWGLVFFVSITGLGMIFRSYLNRLQLLMVPRLSAIMILVVLSIYIISVIAFNLNIHAGLSISLFPLVILTMLIERMSMTWEEFGASTAVKSAIGSIFVAVLAYIVMKNDLLTYLMLTFPELLLVILALTIMIGRYNGYKLTEYYRFRALTRTRHNKENSP